MGRGPSWHAPRHLAGVRRSRTDAPEHLVAEWLPAAVAIVLTIVVLVAQMVGRPGAPEPGPAATGPGPPGPRPTTPGPATTGPPAAWLAIGGARVERTATAAPGTWAGGFTPTGRGAQGMAAAGLARSTPGRTYAATLRVQASRPGTLVLVTLLEVAGGRRGAADTIGAVLTDGGWQRIEVAHEGQRPGAALAVEIVLPRGSPRAAIRVDDLRVAARRH
jgi:hypothetical protein